MTDHSTTSNTSPDLQQEQLLAEALRYHQQGQIARAQHRYRTILERQPDNANVMQLLGTTCLQQGELAQARDLLERAIELSPEMAQAHCNLAVAFSQDNEVEQAIEAYERSLSLQPDLAQAYLGLAGIYSAQRQPAKAVDILHKATLHLPEHWQIWLALGQAQSAQGKHEGAVASCEKALALQPDVIETLDQLGNALGELKRYDKAADCFQRIIALATGNGAPAHALIPFRYKLGLTRMHQQRLDEAVEQYRAILELNPDHADAWHDLGMIERRRGNFEKARSLLEKAMAIIPGKALYHHNHALVMARLGDVEGALASYRKTIELAPDWLAAHRSLAAFCHEHHDHRKAIETLKAALPRFPNNVDLLFDMGIYHENWGRPEEAEIWYQRVLEIAPDNDEAAASIAAIRILQGHYDEAMARLSPLLDKDRPAFRAVSAFAAIAHRFGREQDAIHWLRAALDYPEVADKGKAELHFALGRLYDRRGRYDEAFAHYRLGNELVKPDYHPEDSTRYFDRIIAVHTPDQHPGFPRSSNTDDTMIFVVGLERSGTSLVEQILASHPEIHGAGELGAIPDLIYDLLDATGAPYPECAPRLTPDLLNTLATRYLQTATSGAGGAKRVIDKLPGNFVNLGLIDLLLPKARVIHCRRDPRDTCLSCYFQQFGGDIPYSYDLRALGHYYREHDRLMAHWRNVIRLPLLEIDYESLIDSPAETIRKMVAFAGLDWDERCLNFHATRRTVATASSEQVRNPLYRSSIGRWKHYEKHLSALFEALSTAK